MLKLISCASVEALWGLGFKPMDVIYGLAFSRWHFYYLHKNFNLNIFSHEAS
jgi:hypothetical protein